MVTTGSSPEGREASLVKNQRERDTGVGTASGSMYLKDGGHTAQKVGRGTVLCCEVCSVLE